MKNQQQAAAPSAQQVPKNKQTTLGLYVDAAQAYEMWKADPEHVKIIDVRTPIQPGISPWPL